MAKKRSKTRNQNQDASSSSRKKRFKNADVAPWSDVNRDVFFIIMMQLGVVDFLACSGVCKSWWSLALSNKKRFMESMPPMSMLISNEKDSYLSLEDFKGRRFKTILPHSDGRTCVGVTCGYVILWGRETRDIWLVNPITRHELHFSRYPFYLGLYDKGTKAILVFSPSISEWVFVVSLRKILLYNILDKGKRRWNIVYSNTHPTPNIVDLHAFKEKIYTLHTDCSLHELTLSPNQKPKWTLVETKNIPDPDPNRCEPELVNLSEKLYMLHPVKVLELDFSDMKWVFPEMNGEYAFFVSKGKPFAAIKMDSRATARNRYMTHAVSFNGDKTQCCIFYHGWMWYFPHDCLNVDVNLLE